jgi:hypothetical protein
MRRLLPLAAVLAAALLPATASAAAWSAPQTVSAPHTFVGPLLAATGFDGTTVAGWAWQDNTGTDARGGESTANRPPGAAFAPERPAPDGTVALGAYGHTRTLALAEQGLPGRVSSVGTNRSRITISTGTLTGGFTTPASTLATEPVVGLPQLAANAHGTVLIAWIEPVRTRAGQLRRVVRAVERRNGVYGRPSTLSGVGRADTVAVAVGADGTESIIFSRSGSVIARVKRPGHGWGSLRRLATESGTTSWRVITQVDPRGQVRAVWRRHQLRRDGVPARNAIEGAAMLVGRGTFTPAQTILADGSTPPRLVPTDQGWALVTTQATAQGPQPVLFLTRGRSTFGPALPAAPTGAPGLREPDVVFTPNAGVTVAWTVPLAGQGGDGVARAATLHTAIPDAVFGAPEDITPAEAVHEVRLATDPRTNQPVAIWSARPEGTGPQIPIADIRSVVRSATRSGA